MPNGNNRTCHSQIRADALALLVPADPPASAPTAAPPPAIVARVAKRPMEKWVGDDATVAEMTRGLSAKVTSPRNCYFTIDDKAAAAGAQGNMARRMNNHLRRKRAASINMPKFWRLLAQGMSVAEMAAELGVSTRSVERAKTMRRCDG